MTMPSGAGWVGAHLAIAHPLAACVVCLCGWQIISSDALDPTVVLTMDDATAGQYEYGLPIADEFDIQGTLYVNTQLVLDQGEERGYYMTMNDVKTFHEYGWEIGSHTANHENLLELNDDHAVLATMQISDDQVRAVTGDPEGSVTFAYPYGAFDEVISALAASVFSYSVNTWSYTNGINTPETFEPHSINRFDVDSAEDVQKACDIMDHLEPQQTFVIAVHKIVDADESGEYELTGQEYRDLLTCIKESGVTTKTLRQAAIDLEAIQKYGANVVAKLLP